MPKTKKKPATLAISADDAFLVYCQMEFPTNRGLHLLLKEKYGDKAPSHGCINYWSGKYCWVDRRLKRVRSDKAKEIAASEWKNSIFDPEKFVASTDLRHIAAFIGNALLAALNPKIGANDPAVQEIISNSAAIGKLTDSMIKCIEASEGLVSDASTKDKLATDRSSGYDDNMAEITDFVAVAAARMRTNMAQTSVAPALQEGASVTINQESYVSTQSPA